MTEIWVRLWSWKLQGGKVGRLPTQSAAPTWILRCCYSKERIQSTLSPSPVRETFKRKEPKRHLLVDSLPHHRYLIFLSWSSSYEIKSRVRTFQLHLYVAVLTHKDHKADGQEYYQAILFILDFLYNNYSQPNCCTVGIQMKIRK